MNVLLIDLSSIAHPLFHVSASDPDPNATSTKTVERVRALASGQPHVAVCAEGGRSFRKDLDPTYKANRPESDAALQHQIALALDTLRADGFPVWSAKGYEADDIIATAVDRTLYVGDGSLRIGGEWRLPHPSVTIVSADKDLLQLVGRFVSVKSLKDGSILDIAAVEAKFGVRPDQMLDFLALCGDAADNIKGCTDVGKVRAAGLLNKYGTIEDMFAAGDRNADEFTPALTANLKEFRPRLDGVRALLRLRTDAPINVDEVLTERVPLDVATFGGDDEDMEGSGTSSGVGADAGVLPCVGGPRTEQGSGTSHDASGLRGTDASDQAGSGEPRRESTTGLARRAVEVIEPTPVEWERQLEPRNMAQTKLLATDLLASRNFSAYGHPAGVMATILAGRELGLPAMASLRAFHIVEGKPYLAADFIRALVLRSGVVEYFRCTERTNERATFIAKRKGDPELSLTFTIEDARRAFQGDDKKWAASGWGRNPADMLVARAGAKLARLVAPDVVSGLYAPEEFE